MKESFKYIEIVNGGVTNRGNFIEEKNYKVDYYGKEPVVDAFHSAFMHSDEIIKYTDQYGGKTGYNGEVSNECLFWDIDSNDLEKAHTQSKRIVDKLCSYNPDNILVYFSGCKGFHIIYYCPELEQFTHLKDQHILIKNICTEIANGQDCFDNRIYDKTRIIRSPNTINSKTSLFKIPLTLQELNDLNIQDILSLSSKQRSQDLSLSNKQEDRMIKLIEVSASGIKTNNNSKKINHTDLLEGIAHGFQEGNRNDGLTSVAGLLRSRNFGSDIIHSFLSAINNNADIPIPNRDVWNIVNSVNKYNPNPLYIEPTSDDIITMREAADKWVSLRKRAGKLNSGFKHIDDTFPYFDPGEVLMIAARGGVGKAQPLSEPILTPFGWSRMGNIKKDSYVVGSNGLPIKVTGVFPQGTQDVYKVSFSDGTYTRCTKDHLWYTQTYKDRKNNRRGTVKNTKEIIETLKANVSGYVNNHSIPYVFPIQYNNETIGTKEQYWAIGLFLGDGCWRTSTPRITLPEKDVKQKFEKIINSLGDKLNHIEKYDYSIVGTNFYNLLVQLKIKQNLSYNKKIPKELRYISIEKRLSLLQGLIDSDGSVVVRNKIKGNTIEYSTTSRILCLQVCDLVRSLGGRVTFSSRLGRYKKGNIHIETRVNWRVIISMPENIVPCSSIKHLSRYTTKRQRPVKYIVDIKYDGQEECQCIKVDSKDNLYVTRGYNLTHNTTMGMQLSHGIAKGYDGYGLFASLEMPTTSIFVRSAIMELSEESKEKVDYETVTNRLLESEALREKVINRWSNLLIVDKTSVNIEQLQKYFEVANEKFNYRVNNYLIDYVGLINGANNYEGLSEIARGLKQIAKSLATRIILVVQLSRKAGDGTIPVELDMLRDSGALEESADYIMGMWLDKKDQTLIHCKGCKNRFGERGITFNIRNTGLHYTSEDCEEQ